MMWLMKLPLKIVAGVAVFLLSFMIMLGRLFGDVSSWLLGILLLVIIGSAVYCGTQARWQELAILTVMALVVFLILFLIELALNTAERFRDSLGDFIHS